MITHKNGIKKVFWTKILEAGERHLYASEIKDNEFFTLADIDETIIKVKKIIEPGESYKGLTASTKYMYVEFVKGNSRLPLFSGINMKTGEDEFKTSFYMSIKAFCNSVKVPILN
jgi:hypothetical protein